MFQNIYKTVLGIIIVIIIFGFLSYQVNAQTFTGKLRYNSNIRTAPSLSASKVFVLPKGTEVQILNQENDWYRIKYNNAEYWVYADLVQINNEDENIEKSIETKNNTTLLDRVKGRLLLQVESHGEIWYVDPVSLKKYFIQQEKALPLFRKLALGISNNDLNQIEIANVNNSCLANSLSQRLRGRLLLAVEDLGRVWYVADNNCRYEITKDNILDIFRSLSLGISNADLEKIESDQDFMKENNIDDSNNISEENLLNNELENDLNNIVNEVLNEETAVKKNSTIHISQYQKGEIPSNIDLIEANKYWLEKINELRRQANLRELVLDQRFIDTAIEWAVYNGSVLHASSHERPDGKSMHEWINTKNLDWTERYSEDGWQRNYFTENIAWNLVKNDMASLKHALDYTLKWMLAEKDYNGAHYRTIYHPDWNSVGLGFYFEKYNDDYYKVYIVMHYGSLELSK